MILENISYLRNIISLQNATDLDLYSLISVALLKLLNTIRDQPFEETVMIVYKAQHILL